MDQIPKDNPKFKNKPNWLTRNLSNWIKKSSRAWLCPFDKKIYISNHGARGGDWFGELKKVEKTMDGKF